MSYAAFTAAASAHPVALPPALPARNTLRGNPNLAVAPHGGARTRAGGPCRSPAVHGKRRCRMHGGRSPVLCKPEGLPRPRSGGRIRVRDARTIDDNDGTNARADNRHRPILLRVSRVEIALDRYQARLPLAPSANRLPKGAPTPGPTALFTPSRTDPLNRETAVKSAPTVPFKPFRTDPMNREPTAKPGSTALFTPSRTDPLNREPTAKPGSTVPFKPSRTDPLNREPTATPGTTAPFTPSRTDPLNREPLATPGPTAPWVAGQFLSGSIVAS